MPGMKEVQIKLTIRSKKLWPSLWPLAHSLSRCDHLGIYVSGPNTKGNQNEAVSCQHGVLLRSSVNSRLKLRLGA